MNQSMDNKSSQGFDKEWGAAIFSLVAASIFTFFSFYDADPEVYQFPRIIAIFLVLLGLVQTLTALASRSLPDQKTVSIDWLALVPGLVVGLVFVLCLEVIGFYTCSFLAFIAITSLYGKRKALDPRALMYKVLVSGIFTLILYGLFCHLSL